MENQARRNGKAGVRKFLIEPCERRGLCKPNNMKAGSYQDYCKLLCDDLAYASEATLTALVEVVCLNAGGKGRDRWPAACWIVSQARSIEVPPAKDTGFIRRLVAVHGLDALRKGKLVAMVGYAIQSRSWPNNDFARSQIEGRADVHRRRLHLLAEAERDGRHKSELAAQVAWYRSRQAELIALLSEVSGEPVEELNKQQWVPNVAA